MPSIPRYLPAVVEYVLQATGEDVGLHHAHPVVVGMLSETGLAAGQRGHAESSSEFQAPATGLNLST